MKYQNPIVKGFYPDPSVCKANGKFYLVCSTMHYFPGVPIFESDDLVNWKQIGHCLTRKSQVDLETVDSSGGVFAPSIRYNNGRFYMCTTNSTYQKNFYVWTDDIYGEWSEPIFVDQGGIDPSFYFEDGNTYFMSNGEDEDGVPGIVQCQIDIETGKKLTKSKTIWQGTGGRYLEGPHLYKIKDGYYLLAAEGGTEYGHMVTYARGDSPYGEFKSYAGNPVLTNRNLGGFEIQGIGHGDLIEDYHGNWWIISLGFRQIDRWWTFHHLGREVFLTPVKFEEDGWFKAGQNGTTQKEFDLPEMKQEVVQKEKKSYTFENTDWKLDWCYLRAPKKENYELGDNSLVLKGTDVMLDTVGSPSFLGLRQKDFNVKITCDVSLDQGEGGITLFMDENHHYDLALRKAEKDTYEVVERLNVGTIKSVQNKTNLETGNTVKLMIEANPLSYTFSVWNGQEKIVLGTAGTRYLSTEVAMGFTGVIIGLYAVGENTVKFWDFKVEYL